MANLKYFSDVYSNKHEKILLRQDHIDKLEGVCKVFNMCRWDKEHQRALTVSDIVNACLDIVLSYEIPFHTLISVDQVKKLIIYTVYRR